MQGHCEANPIHCLYHFSNTLTTSESFPSLSIRFNTAKSTDHKIVGCLVDTFAAIKSTNSLKSNEGSEN